MKDLKSKIRSLQHNTSLEISTGMDSGVEVWRLHDTYVVFSIPLFGGTPTIEGTFSVYAIDDLIELVKRITND